jgi:GAF domain-containing protein/HAMP domain-containing protein
MAGAAYFRARTLLREQAVKHSENLLTNQLKIINREIGEKESVLGRELTNDNFTLLIELGLHANPQSNQFTTIRDNFITEFQKLNSQENRPVFDQFFLVDSKGIIKISSNPDWQGKMIDPAVIDQTSNEFHSLALFGLTPIYTDQFILFTALNHQTSRGSTLGTIVGITEKKNLQDLIQPLNGLSPLANTYFLLSNDKFVFSNPDTGEFTLVDSSSASQQELTQKLSVLMNEEQSRPEAINSTSPNGKSVLAQLQWFPKMHAGVVLEVNSTDIYGQISSLAPFTILLVIGTLAATGLVLIFGVNRVINPLRSLTDITRRFAEGDWERRAEVSRDDEIGLLAHSFNNMADELSGTYRSLEQKVDERTQQMRAAAEVAQNITTLSNLDEMLNKTVELLVQRFGYYQASIYLMDRGGKYIGFKTGNGPATQGLAEKKYRLEVGSQSIIGWASAYNRTKIASDVLDDSLHLKNELLPETRSEASVPFSLGSLVLGVLDVQSTQPDAFSGAETIVMLQTLASQIASAIQMTGLIESSHVNFAELERLYRSSRLIAAAGSEVEILKSVAQVLTDAPFPVVLIAQKGDRSEVILSADSTASVSSMDQLPGAFDSNLEELSAYFNQGPMIVTADSLDAPQAFQDIIRILHLESAAFLPIRKHDVLFTIIMLGAQNRILSPALIQPYFNFTDLVSITLEKADAVHLTEKHLREVESLATINELVASAADIQSFFRSLLEKIHQIIGKYNMMVALYDEKNNTISIPFNYENGKVSSIDSFPLGEGLTSILLRTHQPLMIVEDIESTAAALGAKLSGTPAKSWMGAPMMVQNKPIGALIIQDLDREHAFKEADLRLFTSITSQVAGVINNVHLLDESQHRAIQLETAAEIARDISGSLNLDELLIKAVNFIRERFDFYHASIFLHDLPREFAVIREATGEAGAQMKRSGHKIGIGSKSIVGFVTSRGELLVVNDTSKDATYYANPLLPDTRSEAAVPLKVGERILGALDVQSTKPYAFSDDNLRSLQILADQLAVAVVNTELFAETQEHLSQHRLLHHITTTASSGTTLEEAMEIAVNGLQVTLGGDRVTILLADREKKILIVKASTGYAEDVTSLEIPIGTGITGWAASHRRPLRIRDVGDDSRYIQVSSNTRSELAIPLIYRNELLGILNVESEQLDAYTQSDEEMLGTLGGSLAAIIANARLLEQIRIQAERERVIYEVTTKIRRSTDIQSILMTAASEITRVTGARYANIQIDPIKDSDQEEIDGN